MRMTITAAPRFSVPLSQAQVGLLRQLSRTHYDSTCQAASVPGVDGFIYGWGNRLAFALEEGEPAPQLDATWAQMDLSLKILENTMGLSNEEKAAALHLTRNFRGALDYARELVPVWTAVFGGMA